MRLGGNASRKGAECLPTGWAERLFREAQPYRATTWGFIRKGRGFSPTYGWVTSRKGAGWAERKRSPTPSIAALDSDDMEIPAIPQQAVATREEPANGQ